MDAYAVFEGGGVKGAAFSGALKAAEEHQIKFVGYGGASAGAIVAFLSTVGLSAEDVRTVMKQFQFSSLVNEWRKGELQEVSDFVREAQNSKIKYILKPKSTMKTIRFIFTVLNRLRKNHGIYDDRNIISLLTYYTQLAYPNAMEWCDTQNEFKLTFNQLFELTGKELKVIATDLNSGLSTVFSHTTTPDSCVFQAVSASSSYPFVFKPKRERKALYIDGGVSCNLPTFLFHGEKYKNLPIFAFDLYKDEDSIQKASPPTIFGVITRVIGSLLDASTDIISDVVGGIGVPVKVPNHVSTLDFAIDSHVIDELFKSGYDSANQFFLNHPFTQILKDNPHAKDKAQLLYGSCHDPVLRALVNEIYYFQDQIPVKAWIYTSINAIDEKILSFSKYSTNGVIDDHEFQLDQENIDCVKTWLTKKVSFSYDKKNGKTRICFPILRNSSQVKNGVQYFLDEKNNHRYTTSKQILGVLCLSADLPLEYCYWFTTQDDEQAVAPDPDFLTIVWSYAAVIEKAMLGSLTTFQLKD